VPGFRPVAVSHDSDQGFWNDFGTVLEHLHPSRILPTVKGPKALTWLLQSSPQNEIYTESDIEICEKDQSR
jgi:hypothetical protein